MRWAVGIGVIAVAFAAALFVHQRHASYSVCVMPLGPNCGRFVSYRYHPSWEDPVAVLLAIGGVAIAVGIVSTGRSA
jgi:hypothetical protein